MLKNYITVALRNLLKHRAYSVINIVGLAVGIACFALLAMFVRHELSYDTYHENASRIYRVVRENSAATAFRLAPTLNADFPEVHAVRFRRDRQPALFKSGEKTFYESRMFWADADIFEVFSFALIAGNPSTALKEPFTVVITPEIARKYFGEENAIGNHLSLLWGETYYDLKVTGLVRPAPSNSHFAFDILISWATANATWPKWFFEDWSANFAQTYVLLPTQTTKEDFETTFPNFVAKHLGDERAKNFGDVMSRLQPISDIHLNSRLGGEIDPESQGSVAYVVIAAVIAILVLGIACINYVNLATARSISRAKEIGIRKVSGATRWQLIKQFLSEALILSAAATLLGLLLTEFCLPYFGDFVQRPLRLDYGDSLFVILGILLVAVAAGMVSGSYPAFFLSAFQPAEALKGKSRVSAPFIRKALVVTQFALSIILFVAAFVIHNQVDYLKNKRLGFNKEQILVVPHARKIRDNPGLLKTEFLKQPNVIQVTVSSHIPPNRLGITISAKPQGSRSRALDDRWQVPAVSVDSDFFETFGMEMLEGRSFDSQSSTDSTSAFVVNEAFVREIGWTSPLGEIIESEFSTGSPSLPFEKRRGQVVGVVKDFHFESLHNEIGPMIFLVKPYWYFYLSVKLTTENLDQTIANLESTWRQFFPDLPFEYYFLDDDFARLYRTEEAWGQAIGFFSSLSIFIACLGLLGLSAFTIQLRTKEVGVRKILGASVVNLTSLLSKDFVQLVLVANLIAWPLAWLASKQWLQNFAYQSEISWWVFALAGGLALFIAVLTVSTQAIRVALANPVDSLRCE